MPPILSRFQKNVKYFVKKIPKNGKYPLKNSLISAVIQPGGRFSRFFGGMLRVIILNRGLFTAKRTSPRASLIKLPEALTIDLWAQTPRIP
jgi:hypothetical protein